MVLEVYKNMFLNVKIGRKKLKKGGLNCVFKFHILQISSNWWYLDNVLYLSSNQLKVFLSYETYHR